MVLFMILHFSKSIIIRICDKIFVRDMGDFAKQFLTSNFDGSFLYSLKIKNKDSFKKLAMVFTN